MVRNGWKMNWQLDSCKHTMLHDIEPLGTYLILVEGR